MSNLVAKYLSRGQKEFPSIVNIIDRQLMKQALVNYSARYTLKCAEDLVLAIKSGKGIQKCFNLLSDAYNAPRKRDKENLHPSELLGGCSRAMYYRLKKVPETDSTEPNSAKTQRIFDVGHFFHRYIQKALTDSGHLIEDEVAFYNPDIHLIGHTDGWLLLVGTDFILEIKTCNDFAYKSVLRAGAPIDRHVYQAAIYVKEINRQKNLNIKHIVFLYINKNDCEMKEFVIHEEEFKNDQDDAYEKIAIINEYVTYDEEPARVCKIATEKRALGCPHCSYCFNLIK